MQKNHIFKIIPSFVTACIIPLIVQLVVLDCGLSVYDWFSANDTEADFFLVGKMVVTIITALVMLVIILIHTIKCMILKDSGILHTYSLTKDACNRNIYISLGIYVLLAVISACMAKGRSSIITGGYAQHETILVIISYGIIFLYTCSVIDNQYDIYAFVRVFICGALVMAVIGVFQYSEMDIFGTYAGKCIITALSGISPSRISGVFEPGMVYMTLYNPNYVGTYVSLALPLSVAGIFVFKRTEGRIMCAILAVMLVICLIGSEASAGIAACAVSVLVTFLLYLFTRKRTRKYAAIIAAAVFALVILSVCGRDRIFTDDGYYLEAVSINDNRIELTADVADLYIEDGKLYNAESLTQENFPGIILEEAVSPEGYNGFNIKSGSICMFFTNDNPSGKYYYRNVYGKYTDDVKAADAYVFDKCQKFATHRGYIWSKTIPLLKKHMLLGCGPDNFIFEFPNNDYLALLNNGYNASVVTRPHNMYLQTAVQTGALSLAAFVVIFICYAVSCAKALSRMGKLTDMHIISMALFTAVTGYMICGLAYDSSVCTAPVFWTVIAAGCACNVIIKDDKEKNDGAY